MWTRTSSLLSVNRIYSIDLGVSVTELQTGSFLPTFLFPSQFCNTEGIWMHTRILSNLEEKQIRTYLKQDGEKNLNMRVLVSRFKRVLPQIRSDLDLIEKLLSSYSKETEQSAIAQAVRKRKIHTPKHKDLFVYHTHL